MDSQSPNYAELAQQVVDSELLQNLAPPLQVALFLGGLAFMSAALVSVTAFTRIVIVFSFVRRALTTQEIPPNPVVIGLSMFMTLFVMGPTFDEISSVAVSPYLDGEMQAVEALQAAKAPLQRFMIRQTREPDVALFLQISGTAAPNTPEDTPMRVLIPAFIISELKTAFLIGFCIYLPFLLIDLVVSTILMSLGMMMMPPVMMSLPLKILLFVLVDGWQLIAKALSTSFG